MQKSSTLLWMIVTVSIVTILRGLLPSTEFTRTLLLVIALIGGLLAMYGGGERKQEISADKN